MKKQISTSKAPEAIGPYSQGLRIGNTLYVAGQIPCNPETGEIPGGIACQTETCLNNVRNILDAGGCTMDDVVDVLVFLKNMDDFEEMNEEYAKFFRPPYPVRGAIQAARLPMDVLVEIKVIAVIP